MSEDQASQTTQTSSSQTISTSSEAGNNTISTPQPENTSHSNRKPSKSSKPLLVCIILAILLLASVGACVYFAIKSANQSSEISDLTAQLSDQTVVVDDTTNQTDNSNENPITKSDVLAGVPASLTFATDHKCLNLESYPSEYNFVSSNHDKGLSLGDGLYAFTVGFDYSTATPHLYINYDAIKDNLSDYHFSQSGQKDVTDFGLSGTPIDAFYGMFSPQSTGYEYMFFLMSDGSIEYLNIFKSLENDNFHSAGKLPNINNVIKAYTITANPKNCTEYCQGTLDILAQRADGNYYSINQALENAGAL